MRFCLLLAVSVVTVLTSNAASAVTLTFASYGSTNSAPAGVSNTSTIFLGGGPFAAGPSYNVPAGTGRSAALVGSSWVSIDPNDYPGGGVYPPAGMYSFSTSFFDNDPRETSGSITLLADDTASVYLNGTLIASATAVPRGGGECSTGTPNCTASTTYDLTGFGNGTNILRFDVKSAGGTAIGLDFGAQINITPAMSITPEPSSLALLGTGVLAFASGARKRFFKAKS